MRWLVGWQKEKPEGPPLRSQAGKHTKPRGVIEVDAPRAAFFPLSVAPGPPPNIILSPRSPLLFYPRCNWGWLGSYYDVQGRHCAHGCDVTPIGRRKKPSGGSEVEIEVMSHNALACNTSPARESLSLKVFLFFLFLVWLGFQCPGHYDANKMGVQMRSDGEPVVSETELAVLKGLVRPGGRCQCRANVLLAWKPSWRQLSPSLLSRSCSVALFIKWITICSISCHPPFKLVRSFITFRRGSPRRGFMSGLDVSDTPYQTVPGL